MAVPNLEPFELVDIKDKTAESVFHRLVQRGNGGTIVRSTAAPALSTQFVKSTKTCRTHAGVDGYLASVIYPEESAIDGRYKKKHEIPEIFGYDHTKATDGYPGGFGERSARALAREENTYQFKGAFPSSMLAFSKLRARVEARGGNTTAINRVFAMLWGLKMGDVEAIPRLLIDGSESTRMSAMEDRAYHALAGHPGHNGGYRIDLATIAPDALGSNVPLNWPRIRTALKAIALCQTQGDAHTSELLGKIRKHRQIEFGMDFVMDSQPRYERGYPWEVVLDRILTQQSDPNAETSPTDPGYAITSNMVDECIGRLQDSVDDNLVDNIQRIAVMVTRESSRALKRTVEVIMEFDRDRALVDEKIEDQFTELDTSMLSSRFEVPRFKLTRDSVRKGFTRPYVGSDSLPDIVSHGIPRRVVDHAEFREAHLGLQLNIGGILNLAVYLICLNAQTRGYAYQLLQLIRKPESEVYQKTAVALRRESLYEDPRVRAMGPLLFGDAFQNSIDLLLRNMMSTEYRSDLAVKQEMWAYLSHRTRIKRSCPIPGDWRNMLNEVIMEPEGWTLYYWARVSIGKAHQSTTSGILAPIAAGKVTDFMTLMKMSVKEKASRWAQLYASKYKLIEDRLEESRLKKKEKQREAKLKEVQSEHSTAKYIPPHLRKLIDLEHTYDADEILNRDQKYEEQEYRQMVEMQSKSKFFKAINVYAMDGKIAVGVTDEKMHNMLVEFYQARWFSLEKRINKAKERGEVFHLGIHAFEEHPWGSLAEELPDTYEGMLEYMRNLDSRAWTLPPDYLQSKFRKSISELWGDVSDEISRICVYIDEVHNGLATEQEEADEVSPAGSVLQSMIGVPPIVLPAYGYTPPFVLPRTHIDVEKRTGEMEPHKIRPGLADPTSSIVAGVAVDDLDLPDDVDDDDDDMDFGSTSEWVKLDATYMTYREIWHQLAMPDVDDDTMRTAFAVPYTFSMDDQHLDSAYGPLVQPEERLLVAKRWGRKREMLMYRLGKRSQSVEVDDM